MQQLRKHLSPATVLAAIAVFFALAGGAYALGKNSVGSKQLKKNAVTTAKIKKNAVTTTKIKSKAVTAAKLGDGSVTTGKLGDGSVTTAKLASGAVTGDKIDLATLGPVPKVEGHATFPQTRIVATDGTNANLAREAAPEVPMFTVGPVTIYAKCYTDTTAVRTYASFFIKTTENGVIFQSDDDDLAGDPFLNSATPETDRQLMDDYASVNSAEVYFIHSDETVAMLPDGSAFEARHSLAVKNGTLPGGNGLYGDGNVCLVAGDITEYR